MIADVPGFDYHVFGKGVVQVPLLGVGFVMICAVLGPPDRFHKRIAIPVSLEAELDGVSGMMLFAIGVPVVQL